MFLNIPRNSIFQDKFEGTGSMARERRGYTEVRNGKMYARLQYTDERGNKRTVWQKVKTKAEGREFLNKVIYEADQHGDTVLDGARMTFEDLANYYEKTYAIDPKYVGNAKIAGLKSKRNAILYLRSLRAYFGKQKIRAIIQRDIEEYRLIRFDTPRERDGKPRSIAGVHRELALLRRMLNVAIQQGWLTKSPFGSGLISAAFEEERTRILTREEEKRLLAACVDRCAHLKPILICALDTGMRQGEIFKLKWKDIEFFSGIITVQALNTKTLRKRQVSMTGRLKRELLSLYQSNNKSLDSSVFGIKTSCKNAFNTVRKAAGLEDVRFHDLRHTTATRMIQVGCELPIVGKILGHTQANTTYRYVNADADTARRVGAALDAFWDEEVTATPVLIKKA